MLSFERDGEARDEFFVVDCYGEAEEGSVFDEAGEGFVEAAGCWLCWTRGLAG